MTRKKCRLWWPEHLSSCEPSSDLLLFGWYMHSSFDSLDIVVATAISPHDLLRPLPQSDLQEILHYANGKMPLSLQDYSAFSLLGHCVADWCNGSLNMMDNQNIDPSLKNLSEKLHCFRMEDDAVLKTTSYDCVNQQRSQELSGEAAFAENCRRWNCSCEKPDGFIEPYWQSSIRNGNWIQLLFKSQGFLYNETRWIPELHHMHLNGQIYPICDVHLIMYELPNYGVHHFSLNSWGSSEQIETPLKKPKWVNELHKKSLLPDLDMILLALNCARAAKVFSARSLVCKNPVNQFPSISMLVAIIWHTVAVFVASISTFLYIILQLCHRFLSYGSQSLFYVMLNKVFGHTWKNVHIRSCQLLYWSIFLRGSGVSQSNVEYAHRVALKKHAIWSSVAIDVLLGNILGLALLTNVEALCFGVLHVGRNITDSLLRSGCVWLMGVPAGFKLNTELAELLGMISLNAIQICSTLWFFMGFLLRYFIEGIALSGIFLGLTVSAALCIDMLKLTTLHVSTLHYLISFLYSQQIQALASLWRLFRGRKWNPLRQRLDSYDYTVEQHVVGSLLFTPLLLLLPTTSVFYIFFTILSTTISFACVMIEITISVLHATPYAEVFLWVVRRRRFPSGIWFKIISRPSVSTSPNHGTSNEGYSPSNLGQSKTGYDISDGPGTVFSLLNSNFATIGQIVMPFYRNIFHGISTSSGISSAYGVISGRSIPSTLHSGLPPTMPWMHISFRDYWRLCHSSVLACRS